MMAMLSIIMTSYDDYDARYDGVFFLCGFALPSLIVLEYAKQCRVALGEVTREPSEASMAYLHGSWIEYWNY